jgi:predicted Holliday junction resolvase-like endonuclease
MVGNYLGYVMKIKLLILAIIVAIILFLIISLSDDDINAVPDSIIEQDQAIIDSAKVLNEAKALKAISRLDELKREEAELEKENKNKDKSNIMGTSTHLDNLLKRYKRYGGSTP